MAVENIPTYSLVDGNKLPVVGFGTYSLYGDSAVEGILSAIKNGYRLLDSAFNYDNEGAVGAAIRKSGVPRDKIQITTKLPGRYHKYELAIHAIEESVYRTGLDYIDLYIIHWPNPKEDLYVEAWKALIEAKRRGLVRSIGVSNFLAEHIDRLVKETGVTPAVNQIEISPYFPQKEQREFDAKHGIVTESWSPLGPSGRQAELRQEKKIVDIAKAKGKSPVQVILRWHYQIGALAIPKSADPTRQKDNIDIFDFSLTNEETAAIDSLARPDGRSNGLDPHEHQEF